MTKVIASIMTKVTISVSSTQRTRRASSDGCLFRLWSLTLHWGTPRFFVCHSTTQGCRGRR